MPEIATIAKIHVWKYTAWFMPSNVSMIAVPMAFTLMTCEIWYLISNLNQMVAYGIGLRCLQNSHN